MLSLRRCLEQCESLKSRGLDIADEGAGTIVIHRRGHVRGVWRQAGAIFEYMPAGSNEPSHLAETLEEVRAITERIFERRRSPRV